MSRLNDRRWGTSIDDDETHLQEMWLDGCAVRSMCPCQGKGLDLLECNMASGPVHKPIYMYDNQSQ